MRDVVMWLTIAGILSAGPVLVVIGLRRGLSTTPVEKKYRASGGGLVGVFDAVWSPSAHEAGMERDREQRRAIPAPTPDKGPGRIGDDGRIVIDVG